MNCENCGLPSDATTSAGFAFALETRPETKYQHRSTQHRVWSCTKECVIQALAQNKYGTATHKWPVTLAEFRQLEGEPFFRRLGDGGNRANQSKVPSTGPCKPPISLPRPILNQIVGLDHTERVS
jgi:hypothetical protein